MSRTIAYCRVSSRDQNPQLQLDALHTHGYDQLFAEKQSASTARQGRSSPGPWPPCGPATPWCSGNRTGGAAQPRTC